MIKNSKNIQTSVTSSDVSAMQGSADVDMKTYLETGMVPVMGICAHGPTGKNLQKAAYKEAQDLGWNPGDMLAGPLSEDGLRNLKPIKESSPVESPEINNEAKDNTKQSSEKRVVIKSKISNKDNKDSLEDKTTADIRYLKETVEILKSEIQELKRNIQELVG